jgi:hypothetical protein
MQRKFHRAACLTGLIVAAAAGVVSADFTIERIVPENAVVVVGVHNVEQSCERFRRTSLHELLETQEFKEQREEFQEALKAGWKGLLAELGIEDDITPIPTGTAGMGMYPVIDAELGTPALAMIAFAHFGEQIDGMMQILQKGIARATDEGKLEHEELDILGRTVHVLDFSALAKKVEEDIDDDPFDMFMMMPDFSRLFDGFQRMYLTRDGSGLMLGSDLGSLTESLERMDRGDAGIGRRDDYRKVLNQLGTNDAFGILLTRDLIGMISGADQTGMVMMAGPMASGIFGDIRGIGMSMRIDSPQAMMEQRLAVLMPQGKRGLSRLFDVKAPREQLPRFIGGDTTTFISMNFAFERIADVLQEIIRSNPMIQMAVGDGFDQFEPTVREVTSALGPRVYLASTISQPIEPDSASLHLAIECREEQACAKLLAEYAPSIGFEAQEIAGRTIYTTADEMGMMGMMMGFEAPSASIALADGFMFIGMTDHVLRSLNLMEGEDGAPALANQGMFERAVGLLPQRPLLAWGYADIVTIIEGGMKMAELTQAERLEQMRRAIPGGADDMDGEIDFDLSSDQIDWALIRRYVGPSVSYIEPTDDGFVGVTYYLAADPPADAN